MKLFIKGPSESRIYSTFFEAGDGSDDTPKGGYLYVSSLGDGKILFRACALRTFDQLLIADDVRIAWSQDGLKCAVSIRGELHAIINVATGKTAACIERPSRSASIWSFSSFPNEVLAKPGFRHEFSSI